MIIKRWSKTAYYLRQLKPGMTIQELYQKYLESRKVSTDTRKITPGSLFFALRGPNFNANEFASQALKAGAAFAIIDDPAYRIDERCVLVEDVLKCLQQLATWHRSQLNIPVIGLTGSNGKTTSKELVSTVLSARYRTFATQGNLNNHIGVPLSLLSITPEHEMAVIEMGANHVGEIAALSSICQPTHGFITNIGKAHIGTFGGFENIIRGKSELFQFLIQRNGVAFINSQNPILAPMGKRFSKVFYYPASNDYYHCEPVPGGHFLHVTAENGDLIKTNLIGSYNFENVAVALTIGKFFDVAPAAAHKAIESYVPGNMRSQLLQRGSNTIILDAYNANPTSMQAAIENLASLKAAKKVAILGDMFELEGEAEAEHRKLGALLTERHIDEVFLCGTLIKAALADCPDAHYFSKRGDLITAIRNAHLENATILIKGSRGMKMEEFADLF